MPADLGLVTHTAKREGHELAAQCLRDRLAQRRFAHAGRSDQAEDLRASRFAGLLAHGQILDETVLDSLEAVMIGVERPLHCSQLRLFG